MSNPDELIAAIAARPFVPFVIYLADQRSFEVNHPYTVAVSEDGRAIAVSRKGFHVLDMALVTEIHMPLSA